MRPVHVRITELALHPDVRVDGDAVRQSVGVHLERLLADHTLGDDVALDDLSLQVSPALDADGIGRVVAERIAARLGRTP